MKKELLKKILVPALAAVAFGSVSVGATFALFTSEAETTIDLTAGKIDLKAPVTISSAWELGDVAMTKNSDFDWTNTIGAHIYKDANQIIHLDKLAPGDGAEFTLTPDNSLTNINIKARLVISLQGELAPALEIEALAGTERQLAFKGAGTAYTPWQDVAVGSNPTAFKVKVSFPDHDDGEIRHGTANKDNQYQNLSATISLGYEAIQGNADVDDTLELINTALNTAAFTEGKNTTMFDALQDLSAAQISAISERGYVWSVALDQFFNFNEAPADAYHYFKMYDQMPTAQDYSIYAVGDNWDVVSGLTVGFDAGETTTVSSVTYDRSTATVARDVVIRTNTAATSLTVNAPLDTVKHFGSVGSLNIIAVANASYHEFGMAAFAEIKTGRIALESGSDVDHIHLAKTVNDFVDITVAKADDVDMPDFSRDPVDLSSGSKVVVALQDGTDVDSDKDYVWLTAFGIYEQVTVSESNVTAGTKYAAESGSIEQKEAAQQIANNIAATVDNNVYTLKAEIVNDEWTYTLESETAADITTGVTVEVENNTPVVSVSGVAAETDSENGLTEQEKASVRYDVIDEKLAEEIIEDPDYGDYVARIGKVGYESLPAAVNAAVDGDKVVLLKNVELASSEYILVNKDITLDMNGNSVTGSHDPLIAVGASASKWSPSASELTHTGHLAIRGAGTLTSTNWDLLVAFQDAVIDIYNGNFVGFKSTINAKGGTVNCYGGNFTATSLNATYVVYSLSNGVANLYGGSYSSPNNGAHGLYLATGGVANLGALGQEGPTFDTWRACISTNGSQSVSATVNVYSGSYTCRTSTSDPEDKSVIQIANTYTNATQTVNIYGGSFAQTGGANGSIFNIRYKGLIAINVSGGTFAYGETTQLFTGYGTTASGYPSQDNVTVTVLNEAIVGPETIHIYNSSTDIDYVIVD